MTIPYIPVLVIVDIRSSSGDVDFDRPTGSSSDRMSVTVREDAARGRQVALITAHSPSSGRVITDYREVAGSDPGQYFTVDRESGEDVPEIVFEELGIFFHKYLC